MASQPGNPVAWLSDAASERPQALALGDETGKLSYGELWQALGGWRHAFSSAGLKPGAPLAVVSRHRRRIARAAWLAVYCGLPLLPMSPSQLGPVAGQCHRCGDAAAWQSIQPVCRQASDPVGKTGVSIRDGLAHGTAA